ncbi:polysaccharide lyase [Litoreibacter janthinus]|uniref:Polysaccharide lyase n=1 Tax=Litoreibacter janthinus TaxID=670154 RepID=A0A1I6FVH7_9RHOB|nr:polysaccharide lyase [Litoreibacter janthinus]SFR33817.1 Polysaccharide lyase [Litoreibacter janthinus]
MTFLKALTYVVLGLVSLHIAYAVAHYVVNNASFEPVYAENFEGSDFSKNSRVTMEVCCDHSMELTAPEGETGTAVKFRLQSDDSLIKNSKRSEYRLPAGHFGEEVWYRLRTYLPESWEDTEAAITVFQWHGVPDKLLFEGNRPPPTRLLFKDGDWYIPLGWDTRLLSNPWFELFGERRGTILWSAPAPRGAWEDWVFRITWATDDTGRMTVWRNGEKIADHDGPNTYRDLSAPYLKLGVYVPSWKTQPPDDVAVREMYFDDVWEVYPNKADTLPDDVKALIEAYRAKEASSG